jgi:hypothetical protein
MNVWEKHHASIQKKLKTPHKIVHVGGVRGIPNDLSEIEGRVRIDPKKFIK